MDELMGMNLGADDFITKPYNHNILIARIARIFDRLNSSNTKSIFIHLNLELDISQNQIIFEGRKVDLTKNETKILEKLIQNPSLIVSRDDLMIYIRIYGNHSDQYLEKLLELPESMIKNDGPNAYNSICSV